MPHFEASRDTLPPLQQAQAQVQKLLQPHEQLHEQSHEQRAQEQVIRLLGSQVTSERQVVRRLTSLPDSRGGRSGGDESCRGLGAAVRAPRDAGNGPVLGQAVQAGLPSPLPPTPVSTTRTSTSPAFTGASGAQEGRDDHDRRRVAPACCLPARGLQQPLGAPA